MVEETFQLVNYW